MLRTHTCGELTKKDKGQDVVLCGWVHRHRNHGGLIFIDLRDRYGLTQINFNPERNQKIWDEAYKLRGEWVIRVKGKVVERPKDVINKKLATGEIEVEAGDLKVLSQSKTPPFEIDEEKARGANEALRLEYRFLDLRRPELQKIIKTRDEIIRYIREYFHKRDFIEVQTPILANSSPEGARDYLVPSRLYPGKFYALPQAPQQFKQLLMVAGVDKYFQIAPCFRDEDTRADRHPGDFYQIDMEMSFVEQEDIWQTVEPLMVELSEKFGQKKILVKPFPRLTYKEAISKYGSDKPDLRFGMEIREITDLVKGGGFSVFSEAIKRGGTVQALKVDGGARFTRKEIDELTEVAKTKGAKGLAYLVVKEKGELHSPIVKFLGDKLAQEIVKKVGAGNGDIIFFSADSWRPACQVLGAVRGECGTKLGLKDNEKVAWAWIYDFPMYDYSELEEGKIDFSHNPFSMPQGGMKALETKKPLEILAYQYDLVCNGYEISSGAIRNHEPEIMYKAFALAGYSKKEVDKKFGHMIKAFSYGAPPHGGFAPGLDRLLMILLDCESIRDIYAFPKDGGARDVMMGAPSEVSEKQLKDLGIKIA
ncbi:MAG: aspartate--tRNA ligase [Patescibacteria group bacterium]|nr:aspartate--tRNA ligase [Patescibacteria group bacterium]